MIISAPLGETNGVSSSNICEDIEMHWTTPTIKPNPQADNPALGVAGTFATISKESEYPQSSDSVGGECIYATVNKKKKKPPLPVFNSVPLLLLLLLLIGYSLR